MKLPTIDNVTFTPIDERDGLIGFVDFVYDGVVKIQSVGVHRLLNDKQTYRLVYPNNLSDGRHSLFPIKREVSKHIDSIITEVVNQQLKGVSDDKKTSRVRVKNLDETVKP